MDSKKAKNKKISGKGRKYYVDESGVVAYIPKAKWFEKALEKKFGKDKALPIEKLEKITNMFFGADTAKGTYRVSFLSLTLGFLSAQGVNVVTLRMGNDRPLTIETKDYDLVLAPMYPVKKAKKLDEQMKKAFKVI